MELHFKHTIRKKKLMKIKDRLHDLKKELKKDRQDIEYLGYNNLVFFIKVVDDGSQILSRIAQYQSTISEQKTLIETMKQELKVTREGLKQTNTDIGSCRNAITHLSRKMLETAGSVKERILRRIEEDKETLKRHKISQILKFKNKYEQQIKEIKNIRTSEMEQKRHEFEVRERVLQTQNETIRAKSKEQLKILLVELERIKEGVFDSQKASLRLEEIANEASHTKPSMKHFNQWRAQKKTNGQKLKELKNLVLQTKTQMNTIQRQTVEHVHKLNEMVNVAISENMPLISRTLTIKPNKGNKTLVASKNTCNSLKYSLNLLKNSFNYEVNLFMSDFSVLESYFETIQRENSLLTASLFQVEQIRSVDADSQRSITAQLIEILNELKGSREYPLIVLQECAQSKDSNSDKHLTSPKVLSTVYNARELLKSSK